VTWMLKKPRVRTNEQYQEFDILGSRDFVYWSRTPLGIDIPCYLMNTLARGYRYIVFM
jgi:hypothetical protein